MLPVRGAEVAARRTDWWSCGVGRGPHWRAGLLTLGVARWLARYDEKSCAARGVVSAMVLCNLGAVAILGSAGLSPQAVGVAVWPAVGLHAAMTVRGVASILENQNMKKAFPTLALGLSAREWDYDRQSSIGRLDKGLDEAKARRWSGGSLPGAFRKFVAQIPRLVRVCGSKANEPRSTRIPVTPSPTAP